MYAVSATLLYVHTYIHLYRTPQPELQVGRRHTNKPMIKKVATHLSLEADFRSSESTVKQKTGTLKAIQLHFLCLLRTWCPNIDHIAIYVHSTYMYAYYTVHTRMNACTYVRTYIYIHGINHGTTTDRYAMRKHTVQLHTVNFIC